VHLVGGGRRRVTTGGGGSGIGMGLEGTPRNLDVVDTRRQTPLPGLPVGIRVGVGDCGGTSGTILLPPTAGGRAENGKTNKYSKYK
jgi:hypothetical protein